MYILQLETGAVAVNCSDVNRILKSVFKIAVKENTQTLIDEIQKINGKVDELQTQYNNTFHLHIKQEADGHRSERM